MVSYNSTTNTFTFADADHTDTVKNAEVFVFKDVTKTLADLVPVTTTITSDGGGATASVAVAENSALVTTVSATGGTGPIYSIDGGADAFKFAINAAAGALSFKNAPNFEAPTDVGANNVSDVIVKATSGTTSDTQAIAVSVNNINEAPTIASSNTASFTENAANGTFIGGVLSATDPEGSAVKFVLTNDADGRFQIVKDAAGYHLAVARKPADRPPSWRHQPWL